MTVIKCGVLEMGITRLDVQGRVFYDMFVTLEE